jgi:hypothetical protein
MSDQTIMTNNNFNDDCMMFVVPMCKLVLLTYWTVVTLSMHTIYAP